MFFFQSDKNSCCCFHWLIMGKVEIGNFCWLAIFAISLQIFRFFLQKCFFVVLYDSYEFCPNRRIYWLPWRVNFRKKYSNIFSSEAVREMKLKLCIHVHDISLYINSVFYYCCPCAFVAMATLSFHIPKMGKVKLAFFSVLLQIFWKKNTEMFLEKSSTTHMNFVTITNFDWWPWQSKG